MKIFITGAESFIAGTLISRFSGSDVDVAGCDLSASKSPGIAISDIRNPDLGDLIPEGSDAVVHLAALSREADCKGRLDDWFDINVVASVNVLHAAHRRRVK
ncbi:MAG: NAD(P)-dependent oxidoreductase, partial [Pseudomonadota bacterium]|nr:NAD(P)-dependent oxidoreductase [Pseudomonadota bacterium]